MAVNMASPTRTSIVPGPHPMSTMDIPGRRYGSRYAAELVGVGADKGEETSESEDVVEDVGGCE